MKALIFAGLLILFVPSHATAAGRRPAQAATPDSNDPQFKEKLDQMLSAADESIKLLREQITQNQSAPFLANLYLQLGDLLSQRSNVLYYLQMERDKNTDLRVKETRKFSPVIAAQKDSISIYEQILREFPKFNQLEKVLHRLAVAQKSIDEAAAFVATSEKLISQYPKSKEAVQVRLLLGQHFYDTMGYAEARKHLDTLRSTPFAYERNAALYRIGLIDILQDKHADALRNFEKVATDSELKDQDNPTEFSFHTKSAKNNIKREALIDSVRAYTEVYKGESVDPIAYYSRIAPTEILFQETIEKLAFRYIFLKKYNSAIKLLRTLSERTADPQKIMNIYHDVLLMIPIDDRLDIPVAEIRFVLEKYIYWSTHYQLSRAVASKAAEFFETQLRELGTRSHDIAKNAAGASKKSLLLRAHRLYILYLGFFKRERQSIKIATNLADVEFSLQNYLESGSLYLRIYSGEFGPPRQKEALIQNAILALQKPSDYEFYEQLRAKGLLVEAIKSYMALNPKMKKDPGLSFSLVKTYYEQGFYDHALEDLFQFMKRFPRAKESAAAAELILNYFNVRSDFTSLVSWTDKMLALKLPNARLRSRLQDVKSKALVKRLDEQVKGQKDFDVFSQGKSYLQSALESGDASLRSAAFEQALARSRSERDIQTFMKAANIMAQAEKDPKKRADLLNSLADETVAITRFQTALKNWNRIFNDTKTPATVRKAVFEKMIKLNLMLHDYRTLATLLSDRAARSLPVDVQKSIETQISSLLDESVEIPPHVLRAILSQPESEGLLLAIFKAQNRLPKASRETVASRIGKFCRNSSGATVCKWAKWSEHVAAIAEFEKEAKQGPPSLANVEPIAVKMNGLLERTKGFEGSGDAYLDIAASMATSHVYAIFAEFLSQAAKANKQVATILKAKATESKNSANRAKEQCGSVVRAAKLTGAIAKRCAGRVIASVPETLAGGKLVGLVTAGDDASAADIIELQKKVFVSRSDWKPYFDLAELYVQKGLNNHAAATGLYAASILPDSAEHFYGIVGCAVAQMGLSTEARFYLEKASDLNGHKQRCLSRVGAKQ